MKLFLTFDDGASTATPKILDILGERGIKACFFVIVDNALKYPKIIRRELKEGHLIGLHGLTHKSFVDMTAFETKESLDKGMRILKEEFGIAIEYYRPPYGSVTLAGHSWAIANKIKLVLWDVWVKDYKISRCLKKSNSIINQLKENPKLDKILLLHDGFKYKPFSGCTIKLLEHALPQIDELGYEFAELTEQ